MLDRGTVGTSAALVAPVDGHYRLLAAAAAPVDVEVEPVLEDLVWRVARTDAALAGRLEGWRDWSRLEVSTVRVPRAVLVAASSATGELLERAITAAGWMVVARHHGPDPDLVGLGASCLDATVDAVIAGGRDEVDDEERVAAHRLWARVASLARFRDDLAVIAAGPFAERPEGIPDGRLYSLPAPEPVPGWQVSPLCRAAAEVGRHLVEQGRPSATDGRASLRTAIASLAAVLGVTVDGVEIGAAAGSRTLAAPDGPQRHGIYAAGGFLPTALLEDDDLGDRTLRWSTLGGDPAARLDGLRELVLHPWAGLDHDGARLRMTALRAAIDRLESAWGAASDASPERSAGVTVLSGGGFAAVPPAAAALAVIDGIRRPGVMSILHDHAGVLAPLGALPVEDDRRRLLGDLMGDALLPLGSAVVSGTIEPRKRGRSAGSVSIASALGEQRLGLEPGQLQLVDLPPGVTAHLGLDPGEGSVLGVSGRTISMEVRGGLGGLFVDTRPIPLELPPSGEARRGQLEAWEAPAWIGSDR